ncbi:MAG: peptidoglycan D,D-transpeptidase FtsI family protein [Parvibaculales bacterium]
MARARLPVVRAGGDWAAHLAGRDGIVGADLSGHAVEMTRRRLRIAIVCFGLVFTLLAARLIHLTAFGVNPALAQRTGNGITAQVRPMIIDRQGAVLATQMDTTTLAANPREIDDAQILGVQLAATLPELNAARLARQLASNSAYVTLKRGLTPAQKRAVLNLGNPALKLTATPRRVYPSGAAASHLVGFAGSDMNGLAGLERRIDAWLDDARDGILPENVFVLDENGQPVFETSIDIRVQHGVRDILGQAMQRYQAKSAGAIMVDVHNGEIVALVSLPDFDPNQPTRDGVDLHFNQMTLGVYELGSIFKVFTAAMALENDQISLEQTFDTAEPLQIGSHAITDVHGQARPLTIAEIVTHSSNIGAAKLALQVSSEEHLGFLQRLGLTDKIEFDLPETGQPIIPDQWGDIERATVSFGHGLAVTPLHALMAGAAMVNGGVLYAPSLQRVDLPVGQRVISAQSSAHIRTMMRAVVAEGTGRKADVDGYEVIGKTGSAEKPVNGSYNENALLTSFIGAFPASSPRYALLVMFNEPQGTQATYGHALAGWNAAPTAGEIIRRTAPLLNVMPRRDEADRQARGHGPPEKLPSLAFMQEVGDAP